jgi:hypothetical protein
MLYRCANIKDSAYLFTINLVQRYLHLLVEHVAILRNAIKVVKHGHVTQASDWPYSGIYRYIAAGLFEHDVCGGDGNDNASYGGC